jgi:hypothetical protein
MSAIFLNKSKYGLSFYMQYLAHWPEYFQVAESPSGEIMGYSKLSRAVESESDLEGIYGGVGVGKNVLTPTSI